MIDPPRAPSIAASFGSGLAGGAGIAVLCALASIPAWAFEEHVFVLTRHHGIAGNSAALDVESPWAYGYSNQECGIGNSGAFDPFSPGSGSYFFLIVATDGVSREGSYGSDSAQQERPEDLIDPACNFVRDLSLRCDG